MQVISRNRFNSFENLQNCSTRVNFELHVTGGSTQIALVDLLDSELTNSFIQVVTLIKILSAVIFSDGAKVTNDVCRNWSERIGALPLSCDVDSREILATFKEIHRGVFANIFFNRQGKQRTVLRALGLAIRTQGSAIACF